MPRAAIAARAPARVARGFARLAGAIIITLALAGAGRASRGDLSAGTTAVHVTNNVATAIARADSMSLTPEKGEVSFAMSLHRALAARTPRENVVLSPWSVASVLAMAMNGASGGTLEAMRRTLAVDLIAPGTVPENRLNGLMREIGDAFQHAGPNPEIESANAAWLREGLRFAPAFLDVNTRFFAAQTMTLDFGAPEAVTRINQWVAGATHGRISSLVSRLDPDTALLLTNAIYFRGAWRTPFPRVATRDTSFFAPTGAVSAPMMTTGGTWAYTENDEAALVSLPYGGGRFAMIVFLPRAGLALDSLLTRLDAATWRTWVGAMEPRPGQVSIPRFRIEADMSLAAPLSSMGMAVAFDPGHADFSRLTAGAQATAAGGRVYLKDVLHKTWVSVDEEGTEAAAATGAVMSITSAPAGEPFTFIADRPFFFAIEDTRSEVILFAGSLYDPRAE